MIYGELGFYHRELIMSLDKDNLDDVINYLRTLHEGQKKLAEELTKYSMEENK